MIAMMRFKALLIAAPIAAGLLAAPAAHADWHGRGGGWRDGGAVGGMAVGGMADTVITMGLALALRVQSSGLVLPQSLVA